MKSGERKSCFLKGEVEEILAAPSDYARKTAALSGPSDGATLMRLATYASVAVAVVLIAAKAGALYMTGSLALLSSLIDSLMDSVASVVSLFAVHHALVPPDREHRFGHGKAESLAALGQAALVAGSAVFLLWEAGARFLNPKAVEQAPIGVAVMIFSMALTGGLVLFQRSVVRRTGSLAIAADSLHYRTDFLMNAAVIVALLLSAFGGWLLADPVFAALIALYILYSAWTIARDAFDQLMDHELPEDQRKEIRKIAMAHPEVRALHDLRTRESGTRAFIQLHLELDGEMSLFTAHVIADAVEADIQNQFPNAEVIIHQDPAGLESNISDLQRS